MSRTRKNQWSSVDFGYDRRTSRCGHTFPVKRPKEIKKATHKAERRVVKQQAKKESGDVD